MPDPPLLQGLKERKLVQWAAAYLAGAWVVFEVVDTVGDRWSLPEVFFQGLFVVLAIGFPITLVIAWYHGEKGRQRVSGPELLMVAALLVVAGVALSILGRGDSEGSPGQVFGIAGLDDGRPSIAVLPFDNFSPNPDDAYFADGLQEQLVFTLSKIGGLSVRGRTSALQYRENPKPLPEIADEIGVTFILEGSARVVSDEVVVIAQLIDARKDDHLWSQEYGRAFSVEDLVSIQRDIALRVAQEVGAVLSPQEEERIAERPTENTEAYGLYLRGRDLWWTRGPGALAQAIELFEAGIAEDPEFALAYAGLAETYAVLSETTVIPSEQILPLARAAVDRALSLAPDLAEAHTASGYIHAAFEWDWDAAEREYLKAIELNPDYPTAHQWYAEMLAMNGRLDEAFAEINVAVALDPRSPAANSVMGVILSLSGKPNEAIQWFQRARAVNPELAWVGWNCGFVYLETGDYVEAASWFDRGAALSGQDPETHRAVITALSDSTKIPEAVRAVREDPDLWPSAKAIFLAYLGQAEEAIAALEQVSEEHSPMPSVFSPKVSPVYEEIRSLPRFQAVLRRMNLVE